MAVEGHGRSERILERILYLAEFVRTFDDGCGRAGVKPGVGLDLELDGLEFVRFVQRSGHLELDATEITGVTLFGADAQRRDVASGVGRKQVIERVGGLLAGRVDPDLLAPDGAGRHESLLTDGLNALRHDVRSLRRSSRKDSGTGVDDSITDTPASAACVTLKSGPARPGNMQPRDLSELREYVPGRGSEEVARERGVDPDALIALASNENALGPSPAAVEAIREAAAGIHRYPKGAHTALTEAIAERWDVTNEQIWLANGGDGALDYLARAMLEPGDRVLVPDPGFAYYGMSARYHHGTVDTYPLDRDRDFAVDREGLREGAGGARIVYLTSPHNPTGATLDLEEIRAIAEGTPDETLVVVDEAYGPFAEVPSAVSLTDDRDDVAVLRSFSKSYGLAGVRLGYAVVPDAWARAYRKVNTPFAASELACRAGLAALDEEAHLRETIEMVRAGRERLRTELPVKTWPSGGNFVLARVGDGTTVADALLERGVLVRDCSSFGLDDCMRITIGTEPELDRAIAACEAVLANEASER